MDAYTIENLAVDTVREFAINTHRIKGLLSSEDKEAGYDGKLSIYSEEAKKNIDYTGSISVQIKGVVREQTGKPKIRRSNIRKPDLNMYLKDGSLGNPAIIKEMPKLATINYTTMLVRLNKEFVNPRFFYQILLSNQFQRLIHLKVSGSSIPHLFQANMKRFDFYSPSINEQRKIGDFFSKLDKLNWKKRN